MSGPKLSAAELERRRQEQLERERQEALRKLNEARERHRVICDRIRRYKESVLQSLQQISNVYRADTESDLMTLINQLIEIQVADAKDPASYHSAVDLMQRKLDFVAEKVNPIIQTGIQRSSNDQKLRMTAKDNIALGDLLTEADSIIETIKLDFSGVTAKDRLKNASFYMMRYYKSTIDNKNEPALVKHFAKNAIDNINHLLDLCESPHSLDIIKDTLQSILNNEYEIRRQIRSFQVLYDNYQSLCVLTDTNPSPPDSFSSSELLEKAVVALQCKYKTQDELDYIADQINIVMAEHGYSLIASRVLHQKRNNGVSEMDYSLYQADDQSGISVFTDQSGAVMMRMTVLGDDPDISDADRDYSFQRQIDFCSAHMELVEALKERGVFLKQKSYQAPDRRHTWKVKKFTAQSTVQQNQTIDAIKQIDRRKRRRANKKKMQTL